MHKISNLILSLLLLPSLVFAAGSGATQPSANVLKADIASTASGKGAALIGYKRSEAGAVARTVRTKELERISVYDFGATGDGVADDAQELQAAIDALPVTGGAVYLGRGKFRITQTLTISKKVHLVGEGYSETVGADAPSMIIKAASLNGDGITITGNGAILEKFLLDCEALCGGDGVSVRANRVVLRDLAVFRQGGNGVRIGTDAGTNANVWRMEQVTTRDNGGHGVYIHDGGQNANAGAAYTLSTSNNVGDGLYVNKSATNAFVNVHAELNGANGIHLGSLSNGNQFFGGDPEGSVLKNIQIDAPGVGGNIFIAPNVALSAVTDSDPNTTYLTGEIFKLSAGQIEFPATAKPSAGANTLDDYRENTWTPSLDFAGSAVGMTYSVQSGLYTKVGRLTCVQGHIVLTAKGSSTGAARLMGFPHVMSGSNATISFSYATGVSVAGLVGQSANGMSYAGLYLPGTAAYSQATHANFSDTTQLYFSGCYSAAQ